MMVLLYVAGAVGLLGLFFSSFLERRLQGRYLEAWQLIFRASWGFLAWFILTAISSGALSKLFPSQSVYIFSGSMISLIPAFLWGSLVVWVVAGKTTAPPGAKSLATVDARVEAVFVHSWSIAKWVGIAILFLAFLLLIIFLGAQIGDNVEEMSSSSAIILGAAIIAWAIISSRRRT